MEHLVASWKVQWDFWPWNLKFPINPMEIDSKKAKLQGEIGQRCPPKDVAEFWVNCFVQQFFFEVCPEVPVMSGRHDHDSWSVTFMAGR